MENKYVKAKELSEELGLYLKLVTSTKAFENYNSFYNIYDQFEEPCRRIVVLTKYEGLEEVEDINPKAPIIRYELIDGNVWLEEYTLLTKPSDINIDEILIEENIIKKIKNIFK